MNYRHSFHAGNFADLVKHALVLWLVWEGRPSVVLDTHAGAGLYDLTGDAMRSREAEAGVGHVRRVAPSVLRHRLRRNPLDESGSTARVERAVGEILP